MEKGVGQDSIVVELIKAANLYYFGRFLTEEKIPCEWEELTIVLLYRKGDKTLIDQLV